MKIMFMTLRDRVERFTDFNALPKDWEYVWAGYEKNIQKLLEMGGDADAILADAITPVPGELIEAMPNLKIIHSEGVGYEGVDLAAADRKHVYVCNNRGANKRAVAEQTVMLMLMVLRRAALGHQKVLEGHQIEAKAGWSMEGIPELGSMHVGIIGMGDIGIETAKLLHAFGCKVSYNKRYPLSPGLEEQYHVSYLSAENILKNCDIVSLHIPSNKDTFEYMDEEKFAMMKKGAVLINTARGEVVKNEALLSALRSGRLAAAGLDTLSPEPVKSDNPVVEAMKDDAGLAAKITLSPHIGGLTLQTFEKIYSTIWGNFAKAFAGETPMNVVNTP